MDKRTFYKFERQLGYFHPFNIAVFASKLEKAINLIMDNAFEQYHEKFHAVSVDDGCDKEELAELHDNIKLVQTQCSENGKKEMTNIKNKLEEIACIPDNIEVEVDDSKTNFEEILNEYQELRQEILEQTVFMAHLEQELNEYEELEPLMKQAEKLSEKFRILADLEIPIEVRQQLVSVTNVDKDFEYKISNL